MNTIIMIHMIVCEIDNLVYTSAVNFLTQVVKCEIVEFCQWIELRSKVIWVALSEWRVGEISCASELIEVLSNLSWCMIVT